MKVNVQSQPSGAPSNFPLSMVPSAPEKASEVEAMLAQYLPHLGQMSEQLKQTSKQIESSVVEVCESFQGIAERANEAVARTSSFLRKAGKDDLSAQSFESLIDNCSGTLVKILNVTEEAGEISRRAIDRIRQMDTTSQSISGAIKQLGQIAEGNKILALNARIEAARAGEHGAGFAVVAMEVISQTERSQEVNARVSELILNLRTLAGSTLEDLERMNERDRKRVEQCRFEVDRSLKSLKVAHDEMKTMLTGMTEEGASLSQEIGAAVRGLQFQDRTNQRIGHVVDDLEILRAQLADGFGGRLNPEIASSEGFNNYTMHEEREVAGIHGAEASQGDVELF